MKRKFIVASTVGLLWISTIALGATTFASNTETTKNAWMGAWIKMMGNRNGMMKQFTSTWEAQAFRTAVEKAITNKDYTAFVAAHTKYTITTYPTEAEFTDMLTRKATQEKIQTALEAWDYATWKTLNVGHPILTTIDTEAKFKKLQEMHTYQEKVRTIAEELGLPWPKWEGMGMWMGMWMKEGERGMGQGKWMGKWIHNQTN